MAKRFKNLKLKKTIIKEPNKKEPNKKVQEQKENIIEKLALKEE